MTEEIIKCVKGESCIHCGSTYCRFVDEVNELKQENKALKDNNNHLQAIIDDGRAENIRFREENKELENIIKIHDSTKYDYYKLMKENEEWHIKYAGCNTANSAIQEENKKYCSALEEISKIAEKYKDMEGCRIPLGAIKMTVDEVLNEKEL